MSVSEFPQQRQIPAFSTQEKQSLPNCGVETFDEQSDTREGEFIALKNKLGDCKGWAERNKERLQQERSAHVDEIRRIKENHQQEKKLSLRELLVNSRSSTNRKLLN